MAKRTIDFTDVKDSSGINPKHMPEGDYLLKIIKIDETFKDEVPMWNFHMQLEDSRSAVYPYYCKLQENQLWKLRNLLIAAGFPVPKKRMAVDPEKLIGKLIGATLEDDEYEGKLKSVVAAVFPASELTDTDTDDVDDDDEPDTDDEEEEAPPAKSKAAKGKKKKPVVEDDDEMEIDEL